MPKHRTKPKPVGRIENPLRTDILADGIEADRATIKDKYTVYARSTTDADMQQPDPRYLRNPQQKYADKLKLKVGDWFLLRRYDETVFRAPKYYNEGCTVVGLYPYIAQLQPDDHMFTICERYSDIARNMQ